MFQLLRVRKALPISDLLEGSTKTTPRIARYAGRRILGAVTTIGLLAIGLSGCGDNKQGSGATKSDSGTAQSSQFNQLVLQTFRTPGRFNAAMQTGFCTEFMSPTIKTVIAGVATGGVPADPTKGLPAVFAQIDFVCENKQMGIRKPATAWVRVAYDKEFEVSRCQLVFLATDEPFEKQFANLSNIVCKFSTVSGAAVPSPVFHGFK